MVLGDELRQDLGLNCVRYQVSMVFKLECVGGVGHNVAEVGYVGIILSPHGNRLLTGFVGFQGFEARLIKFENCKDNNAATE